MKNKKLVCAAVAVAVASSGAAFAAADIELTVVSWGGAYSTSQQNAYHDPYMARNPGVRIVNDDSSNESVAKLRAMNEVGNISWDLVDVVASDSIRLCDEGLAREIDFDKELALGDDGSKPRVDFGELLVNDCFIPQIVYSTTFAYRTDVSAWGGKTPQTINDVFDLQKFPGTRSLQKLRSSIWSGRFWPTAWRLTKFTKRCRPMPESSALSPNSTPSKTARFGGRKAPKPRSVSPTAKPSSARPTTAASFLSSKRKSSRWR